MAQILDMLHRFLWGAPGMLLILGVGLYLTISTGAVQFRLLPRAVKKFFRSLRPGEKETGSVSAFQALCTALAATIGTGNLVGVAGAICLGGPGAIFWMWVCALIGMATKFAEVTLAVRYRTRRGEEYVGGPMYTISRGMGKKALPLAYLYCIFGLIASFGVGNATQVNAVITGINNVLGHSGGGTKTGNLLIGAGMALLVGITLLGGGRRIGAAAEKLVPFASLGYLVLCTGVLIARRENLPQAAAAILQGAFNPRAVTGGIVGSSFRALSVGCARGVFTNEAGMGTASIAHASAQVDSPAEQGLMGIMEVFLDTIVICTMTALAILSSGVPIPYGMDVGADLTANAFSAIYGDWAKAALAAFLCCFAFATILGWGLYGARCGEFLFGSRAWKWFAVAQTLGVLAASTMETKAVWELSETINALMAVPNLIALAALGKEFRRLVKEYIGKNKCTAERPKGGAARKFAFPQREYGGCHANFHQRQSMRTIPYAEVSPPCGGSGEAGEENLSSQHRPARPGNTQGVL